jgi:hypothetical protein
MTFASLTSGRRAGVWLGAGVLLGIVLTLATLTGLLYTVPRWLVITAEPVSSEAAVVLVVVTTRVGFATLESLRTGALVSL